MNRLVEIHLNELIILRDMYKKVWPNHEIGFYALTNYTNWLSKNPDLPGFHAYSLNGDWSDGTFIILHLTLISAYTLNDDPSCLRAALDLLQLDPKRHYGYYFEPSIRPMVWSFLQDKALPTGKEWDFRFYVLTPDVGSKLIVPELPKGFVIGEIPEEVVLDINEAWPFHYPGSEERLRDMLKYNQNLAVYSESGEMAGWALRYEFGAVAMLHINVPFRKLGLGRYIATALSKMIADAGEHTSGTISQQNEVSYRLFESIGYKQNGLIYCVEILPRPAD